MVEGTAGAARLTLGVNLDYPAGPPDTMEVRSTARAWAAVRLRGLLVHRGVRRADVEPAAVRRRRGRALVSPVDDAIRTMALVEACYASSDGGRYADTAV